MDPVQSLLHVWMPSSVVTVLFPVVGCGSLSLLQWFPWGMERLWEGC